MPHFRSLLIMALGAFAIGTDAFVIGGVLPDIAGDTRVSLGAAGLLVTAFSIAYAIGAPIISVALGRVPRRPVIAGGLVAFTLANALAALAPSYTVLMIARVLAALAAASVMPAAYATAAALVPAEFRGRAMAFVLSGLSVAQVAGVPIGTLVGNGGLGWRATFWLVAALGAAAAVSVWVALPTVPTPPVASLADRARVAVRGTTWPLLAQTALTLAAAFGMLTFVAPVLSAAAGIHGGTLSLVLVLLGVASLAGNTIGGHLTDRLPSGRVALGALLVLAVAMTVLGFATASGTAWLALVAVAAWGVSGWLFTPAQQDRLIASAEPEQAAVALGLNSSAIYAGAALGGWVGGIALRTSPAAVAFTGAGLALLAAGSVVVQLGLTRAAARREAVAVAA